MFHMGRQAFLPGFERPVTDRLFFAIRPDAAAAARATRIAERLRSAFGLTGEPIAPERLHLSLHHLGDYTGVPRDIVARADEAASDLAARPFEVAFDRVASFPVRRPRRPLVLRGGEDRSLTGFHAALGEAMRRRGLGRWVAPRFSPHVTLLYDAQCVTARPVEPVAWTVRELVLVHSLHGQARHVALGRWPLGG